MGIILLAFEGVQLPPQAGCLEKLLLSQRYPLLALPPCLTDRPAQALLLWPLGLLPSLISPTGPQPLALAWTLSSSLSPYLSATILLGGTRTPCNQLDGGTC